MADPALDYAAAGALVLPLHTPTADGCTCRKRHCEHPGKHPRILDGLIGASADPAQVAQWWEMWPEANIGIRPHLGHVVLDIDPRNGGAEQFIAMQDRYGRLPDTYTAATGGGGWHLWFTFDGEHVRELAPGLDVKGHRGYVVAPPSLHASGNRYRWTITGEIAPAPGWFARLLARPPVVIAGSSDVLTPRRMAGLLRVVAEAPEGQRNKRLYWAAARVIEAGGDPNPLIEALVARGYPRREAEDTVASAAKAPRYAEATP